jgi:hypothetical protein
VFIGTCASPLTAHGEGDGALIKANLVTRVQEFFLCLGAKAVIDICAVGKRSDHGLSWKGVGVTTEAYLDPEA